MVYDFQDQVLVIVNILEERVLTLRQITSQPLFFRLNTLAVSLKLLLTLVALVPVCGAARRPNMRGGEDQSSI